MTAQHVPHPTESDPPAWALPLVLAFLLALAMYAFPLVRALVFTGWGLCAIAVLIMFVAGDICRKAR